MAEHSQATPTIAAHIDGANHQVNLRDYLNVRVYPFLKKAITESLEASPEFPLQWLGENLIHQSMLYEGNPDSTKIKERFLYQFNSPVAATSANNAQEQEATQPQPTTTAQNPSDQSVPITNGTLAQEFAPSEDASMADHNNTTEPVLQVEEGTGQRDTDMEGAS